MELTLQTKRLFDRELCESGVENRKIVDIQTFVTCGAEPMSRGFFAGRFECMIGLPLYFNYETRRDVDAANFDVIRNLKRPYILRSNRDALKRIWNRLCGSDHVEDGDTSANNASASVIDWNSPAGVAFKDSLVLSPMAKRFAAARIIHETDRFHLIYAIVTGFLGVEVANFLYKRSIKDLSPAQRRLKQRPYFFVATALGTVVFYWAVKLRNYHYERGSDVSTGSVGPDFAEGGIEYYQKLLARNRALRELLGDEGRRRFTPEGNYKTSIANWIEDLTIPAVHRTLTSRLRTIQKTAADFEEMTYDELAFHLEAKRFHRQPRKTTMPMSGKDWRTKEAREFEEQSGLLEFEARQLEDKKKADAMQQLR